MGAFSCAAGAAMSATLRGVASAASFTILLYYGIANVAALRMPADRKLYADAVPLIGLIGCSLLAASLPWQVMATGFAVLLAGGLVFYAGGYLFVLLRGYGPSRETPFPPIFFALLVLLVRYG